MPALEARDAAWPTNAVILERFDLVKQAQRRGVNAGDLSLLLAEWGAAGGASDLDADGTVGAGDLALLLAGWMP